MRPVYRQRKKTPKGMAALLSLAMLASISSTATAATVERLSQAVRTNQTTAVATAKTPVISEAGGIAQIENGLVRVDFDLEEGSYSVYQQEENIPYVLNAFFQVNDQKSYDGYTFTMSETVDGIMAGDIKEDSTMRLIGTKDGTYDIVLDVMLDDHSGDVLMRAGIVNDTTDGVKVMQMYPMVAQSEDQGGIFVGPDPAQKHTVLTGEANWAVPRVLQKVDATCKNTMMISYRNNPELESFLLGQLSTYSFQSDIKVKYTQGTAIENNGRKSVDASIRIFDNTGKLVDAADTYVGDVVVLNFTEKNPYDSLDLYADRQAQVMKVDLIDLDPYIYECLWWVNFHSHNANNADFAVQEVKDLYERGLANYAIPNLRVEPDTYTNPNEQLWWDDEHWKQFGHLTDTYPTLVEWGEAMRAAGGEPGLYMQPTYRSDDYCELYPEQMYYNQAGYSPDYTDPDFRAHMTEVYENMKAAGIHSIFYDYVNQFMSPSTNSWPYGSLKDQTGGLEDEHATAVEAYREIFALPKQVIGPEARLTENSWEYTGGAEVAIGLIDIQRNAYDSTSFDPGFATVGINQWYRHRTTKLLYADGKPFDDPDPDYRRMQLTAVAMFFGKTTLSKSVTLLSDEVIQDIGKVVPFPVNGISATPIGLLDGNYEINPYVYDYKFDSEYDDHIVLFWNQDEENAREIGVDLGLSTAFGGLGLDPNKEYEVWDFWDWKYVGRVSGDEELSCLVRKNELKTMALREVRETPYLLSTNRHILQGTEDIDVKDFHYDPATKTVTGTFSIVGNDTYKAILALGDNQLVVDSFTVHNDAVEARYNQNGKNNYVQLTMDAQENQDVPFTLVMKEGTPVADTEAPTAVEGLVATADDYGVVTLNWAPSTDDQAYVEYHVYGSDEPYFTCGVDTLKQVTPATKFEDDVHHQGDYYYQVVAVDGSANESVPTMIRTNSKVLSVDKPMTATAGDAQSGYDAVNVLDQDENTIWHTNWSGTDRENMWLDIKIDGGSTVGVLGYLPRQDIDNQGNDQTNGDILSYRIEGSKDGGNTYSLLAEGDFEENKEWKYVSFQADTYTNIRLYAVESVGRFASAAEVRLMQADKTVSDISMRSARYYVAEGTQKQIMVDVYPTNCQGTPVEFTSGDETIATVDANGQVTGKRMGTVTITARVGDQTAQCEVIVNEDGIVPPDTQPPTAITGLKATANKAGVVTLTWNESTDVESLPVTYNIYGGTSADFTPDDNNKLKTTLDTTFTAESVYSGAYYFKVVAVDAAGNQSKAAMVKTMVEDLTMDVENLTVTAGDASEWNPVKDAVDGNPESLWHTDWSGTARENMWIDLAVSNGAPVSALRYLPRQDLGNGAIYDYRIEGSKDGGETYVELATGTFENTTDWKEVAFKPDNYTNIRLYAVTSNGNFASAAEVRLMTTASVASLEMRQGSVTLEPEASAQLEVDFLPTNAEPEKIEFRSDNEAVATVNQSGKVVAVSHGVATITATVVGTEISATCQVKVGDPGVAPEITVDTLPEAMVGTDYTAQLTANGDAPITWSIEGQLPAGLVLDAQTGVISGTPTEAGTKILTVVASNDVGSDRVELTITVKPQPEPGNKALLQKSYDYALTLDTTGVVEVAVAKFEKAKADADAVLKNEIATQEEIDTAWDNLVEAIWGLGLVQGDKELLNQVIEKAELMVKNQDQYVQTNWKQLTDALEQALKVQEDDNMLPVDVEEATDALLTAILAQRYKADKSILEELIAEAENKDLTGYTAESIVAFQTALSNAQAILADESLSEDDQGKVDEAVHQLKTAINGLSTESGQEGGNPDNSPAPDGDGVPSTGDTANYLVYMGVLLGAACLLVVVIVVYRKRHG